jgi:hypothetical protein
MPCGILGDGQVEQSSRAIPKTATAVSALGNLAGPHHTFPGEPLEEKIIRLNCRGGVDVNLWPAEP